ncbi:hypothetical protein BHE74_00027157 [Ensete ventricosum]|nr:hypothetical protein BHE74_00027157 [Ensete ventricosum]
MNALHAGLAEPCSSSDIAVRQTRTGGTVEGKPEYEVLVTNTCECSQSRVLLQCYGLSSVEPVNRRAIRPVDEELCIVGGGRPITKGAPISIDLAVTSSRPQTTGPPTWLIRHGKAGLTQAWRGQRLYSRPNTDTEVNRIYWAGTGVFPLTFCARRRAHVARTPVGELGCGASPETKPLLANRGGHRSSVDPKSFLENDD